MRPPTDDEIATGLALTKKCDDWLAAKGLDMATRSAMPNHGGALTVSWDGQSGYFIDHWGTGLGGWPTEADGFTKDHLRKAPTI